MARISEQLKAIGAAAGGGAVGAGVSVTALPPDTPWWGHLALIVISMLAPYLGAYLPRNAVPVLLLGVLLAACASVTELTGVPVEQRCANYRLTLAQWEAYREAGGTMTAQRQALIDAGQTFIDANCGPPAAGATQGEAG